MITNSQLLKVLLLGSIQALFEGAMYTFVFVWTPALQENTEHKGILLPLGLIFSTFMMSSAVGGAIFQVMVHNRYTSNKFIEVNVECLVQKMVEIN